MILPGDMATSRLGSISAASRHVSESMVRRVPTASSSLWMTCDWPSTWRARAAAVRRPQPGRACAPAGPGRQGPGRGAAKRPRGRARLDDQAAVVELARDHVHVARAQQHAERLRAPARHAHGVLHACRPPRPSGPLSEEAGLRRGLRSRASAGPDATRTFVSAAAATAQPGRGMRERPPLYQGYRPPATASCDTLSYGLGWPTSHARGRAAHPPAQRSPRRP